MQLNEVDKSRIRLEVRSVLLEFLGKPSEVIDRNLGTNVSFKYVYPPGVDQKMLKSANNIFEKSWRTQSAADEQRIHKIAYLLATAFIKVNPELATLKQYLEEDYWDIFMGIISGYNPDDIQFWIEHPDGFRNSGIQKYTKQVQDTFSKFPFTYTGGYLPSPKSFKQIKDKINNKKGAKGRGGI